MAGAQVGIDLHSGSDHRANLPQVRGDLDDPATASLAAIFGAPISIHAQERSGSLRGEGASSGCTVLLYEGGGAHRYDSHAVEVGAAGVLRVLGSLDMVPKSPIEHRARTVISRKTSWSRAHHGGLFRPHVALGERVVLGQHIGTVADATGLTVGKISARVGGVVIGLRMNPVVYQGDALAHVATIEGQSGS